MCNYTMEIALGVAALVVAILVFLFGDNVLHRITGHHLFREKRRKSIRESQSPLSWTKAAETALTNFQSQTPKYKWGKTHFTVIEEYAVGKGRAVSTIAIFSIPAKKEHADIQDLLIEKHKVIFDFSGDILQRKPIPYDRRPAFPQIAEIQGGTCSSRVESVSFPVAFPSKPTVLITPISEKPSLYNLIGVSTTGFTVNIYNDKRERLDDIRFNWLAFLRE